MEDYKLRTSFNQERASLRIKIFNRSVLGETAAAQ